MSCLAVLVVAIERGFELVLEALLVYHLLVLVHLGELVLLLTDLEVGLLLPRVEVQLYQTRLVRNESVALVDLHVLVDLIG